MEFGGHSDIEVLCGTRQPEDLEPTPDGELLIATQFVNAGRGRATGGGMALFRSDEKKHSAKWLKLSHLINPGATPRAGSDRRRARIAWLIARAR
jgi:hypothetical protein